MVRSWKLLEVIHELTERIPLSRPIHLGLLVPWANQTMEAEMPLLLPRRLICHVSRLVPASHTTTLDQAFLSGMIEAIPQATMQLSHLPLDFLAFGCTSASCAFPGGINLARTKLQTTLPFITAFSAICSTLTYYQAQRIMLITPYEHAITEQEVQALHGCGITVVDAVSLGYRDGISDIHDQQILDACRQCIPQEVDAIVLSCTALPTLEVIPLLEDRYHLPVISSNTALVLVTALLSTHSIDYPLEMIR